MNNALKTTDQQHKETVYDLAKPGDQILSSLTPENVDLWHGSTGVSTEAGELLDAVKKVVIYGKELHTENVIEELGDLEFYMEQVRQNLNITREATLIANLSKLQKRYGNQYSDQKAQARADKICPHCNGGGTVFVGRGGVSEVTSPCMYCGGTGKYL